MVPDRQKVRMDGRMDGQKDGRTDDAKTISLGLRRGIINLIHQKNMAWLIAVKQLLKIFL